MGTSVGNMIAPPLVVLCILNWGWQSAFLVTGGPRLAWALLWWFGYRAPEEHSRITPAERQLIEPSRTNGGVGARPATPTEVLRSRGLWAIAILCFPHVPQVPAYNFFIPPL